MKLAIEAVGVTRGGGGRILQQLCAAALEAPRVSQLALLTSPASHQRFTLPRHPKQVILEQPAAHASNLVRWNWQMSGAAQAARAWGADAWICFAGVGGNVKGPPSVNFIQQSLPFWSDAGRYLPANERWRLRLLRSSMGRSSRASRFTVVQSETMKSAVQSAFHLADARVVVLPPSSPLPAQPEPQAKKADTFRVLYVGAEDAYRNIETLVAAVPRVRQQIPYVDFPATLPAHSRHCGPARLIGLGAVRDDQMPALYRSADALVMTSFMETVGLPMLEAMASGVPVVAPDLPYARDLCGTAGLYFAPQSPASLAERLVQLATQPLLRARQIGRGYQRADELTDARPYARFVELAVDVAQ